MVAALRFPLILLLVSVSLALAPAAAALGATPGVSVAEAPPLKVSDVEKTLKDAADGRASPDAPVIVVRAERVPGIPDAHASAPPLIRIATAVAPRAPDAVEMLATLADSGLAPEAAVTLVPALRALAEGAEAVTGVVPFPSAAHAPAVATGLAGAALVSFALPPVPAGAARLYSRIRPGEVLDHPVRRQVYERIRDEPGVHANRIKDDLGIGNGTLVYHLDVLLRERLVTKVDAGRFTRFFAAGSMSPKEMRSRATLLAGSGEKLFDLVTERPGVAVKELAESTGLSVPAVHRALARLESAGLIEKRREGRGHAMYPNPESPLVSA